MIFVGTLIVSIATGCLSLLLEDEYESVVQMLPPKEAKKGFGFADLLSALPIPSLRLGEKGWYLVATVHFEIVERLVGRENQLLPMLLKLHLHLEGRNEMFVIAVLAIVVAQTSAYPSRER